MDDKTQNQNQDTNQDQALTAREQEMSKMLTEQAEQMKDLQTQAATILEQNKALQAEKEASEQKILEEKSDLTEILKSKSKGDADSKVTVEDLTNAELLQIVGEAVETSTAAIVEQTMQQNVKDFGTAMVTLNAKINGIQSTLIKQTAFNNVKSLSAKYADLNDYKADINAQLELTPAIDLEDAYILAKAKKNKGLPEKDKVASERPSRAITHDNERSVEDKSKRPAPKRGVRNFRDIINAGVDKVIDGRKDSIYSRER